MLGSHFYFSTNVVLMMKKILLKFLLISLVLGACDSDVFNPEGQAALDDVAIKSYLTRHNIEATKAPGGFYYHIISEGNGNSPAIKSIVTLNYTAKLIDETEINSDNDAVFDLSNVIWGWQQGLPMIRQGGKILLYVPSGLAYGNASPSVKIPANSSFIFEIELVNVSQ
jgi:FKBP-type peptidyl-prolyl cis-trans isomerase FkpA